MTNNILFINYALAISNGRKIVEKLYPDLLDLKHLFLTFSNLKTSKKYLVNLSKLISNLKKNL